MDPLAEKYPSYSPFQYCMLNPIINFDPNGKAVFSSSKQLYQAGNRTVNDDRFQPVKDENGKITATYCNRGVMDILHQGGDNSLDGLTANKIYDRLSDNTFATEISYQEAQALANQGVTTILAAKGAEHGHVAVVAPGDFERQ